MRTRPALVTAAALALSTPLWAGPFSDCPDGRCPSRASLTALGDTAPAAYGSVYENSRQVSAPGGDVGGAAGKTAPRLSTPAAAVSAKAAPGVPEPKAAEEKSEGLGGFLNKHKWQIGGALVGGAISLMMGGWLGLLVGAVASVAVAFLGPKIF